MGHFEELQHYASKYDVLSISECRPRARVRADIEFKMDLNDQFLLKPPVVKILAPLYFGDEAFIAAAP